LKLFLIQKYFCRRVPPVGLLLSATGPMCQSPVSTWRHMPCHPPPGSAATRPRPKGADGAGPKLPPLFPLPTNRVRSPSPPVLATISRHLFSAQVTAEPCHSSASEAGRLIRSCLHSSVDKAIAPPPSPRRCATAFHVSPCRRIFLRSRLPPLSPSLSSHAGCCSSRCLLPSNVHIATSPLSPTELACR
jgi:hypothetical protein